ncbi:MULTISPECIES: hypothetical protein [unclassified Bartonella]|uniref:hypothetical protein n=1 Tax=unclassified Bartonella TaxID=2645622 RepID=UPI0021C7BB22|nr:MULTISPECIES: hypothetical protein [unclassified Bartonella]UXN04385.1 hypothetical protein N6B01_05030 [Bartonella sp. HY406]UXN07379.1 hypothetical protein N6A79_05140 [Bartonella sp. HY761]
MVKCVDKDVVKFFDDDVLLDAEVIAHFKYKSRISVMPLDKPALSYYLKLSGAEKICEIIGFFSKNESQNFSIDRIDDYDEIFGDLVYQNALFKYQGVSLFIWKQDENKFYVVFGDAEIIDKIDNQYVSNDDFMEILNEDVGLSLKGRNYMLDALRKYG